MEFKERYTIEDLRQIVAELRAENGCPWDKVQTHTSIKKDFVEEVYEVLEAIDLNDSSLMQEELGDVLLQVIFHTQIEEEQQHFTFEDVCNDICRKLIIRHPHVFGTVEANTVDAVLNNWDTIKMQTKEQTTYGETLESVAKSLPALMRAQKIGKRAKKAGFDFQNAEEAFPKILEEATELKQAIDNKESDERLKEEFGDLLFACVNVGRLLGVDAEEALTAASDKFTKRFVACEQAILKEGKDMTQLSLNELDCYWEQVKKEQQ